jgi:hypothetical protein
MSRSDLKADFGLNKKKGGGIFGERTVVFNATRLTSPALKKLMTAQPSNYSANADRKGNDYWMKNRPDTLQAAQANVYKDIDSLQTIPSFRKTMDIVTLVVAGYKNYGWFEVGPVNTFYNFNPVEGFRLRLGGRTTPIK